MAVPLDIKEALLYSHLKNSYLFTKRPVNIKERTA